MSVEFTYYGHSALGLQINGTRVLVDPFFSGNPIASCAAEDAAKDGVDFVLITHGHADHVGDGVDLCKETGATVVSNFEIVSWFQAQGVENAHPQHIGGGFNHRFGRLKLTPAFHGSALPDGSYGGMPAGLHITAPTGERVYIAGDTALFSDMQLIGRGGLDLAVLPIGDNFTMGPDDALEAVRFLKPKAVVPIHYNTWELIEQDAGAWAKRVTSETGVPARVMQPGETAAFGVV